MPQNKLNRPTSINDDLIDIKKQSLYARLKTLFSSETIVRNIGGKQLIVKDTDHSMMAGDRNSLRDRFNRIRSTAYNAYTRDFSLSYQAARIEMFRDYQCVAGDTIIPLPDGTYPTIAELAEKYKDKPQERFYVYSYDHESNSVKLGNAYHPRKKEGGKLKAWKLTFEKGKYIIASGGHPFLMRNGDYKKLEDIKIGDSIMPFNKTWINFIDTNILEQYDRIVETIEYVGEIDVYDVTVEKYQNFASDTVFSHNTMDMDPILSATLDIVSDECLEGNTIIPLLDGTKVRIEDLYTQNKKDFWVYSIDSTGNFKPEKCERVAYNGTKPMFRVILDDGTEIKCTSNHRWVTSDMSIIPTSDLKLGTSLKVFKSKLSNFKFMNGYEMLYIDDKWQFTHRLVAKNEHTLITKRELVTEKDKVIHHASFNKLNNDPSQLQWMGYLEHKRAHAKFNKELWADESKIHEYKEKTRAGHRKYWNEETRAYHSNNCKMTMRRRLENMSSEDRIKEFGRAGSQNGMFNNGYKLSGNNNGRWIASSNRPDDIKMEDYEKDIISGFTKSQLKQKYNILREDCNLLNKKICNKYGISRIDRLKYKVIGYNSFKDYHRANNHRVVSVEPCGEYNAYDLVNVGNSSHLYAIETADGSKLFTHNCLTMNEMGKILTVHCENNNIKEILENLYEEIININFNLWGWTRNMLKLGDHFLKLYVSPEYGVYMVEPMNADNVERIENSDPYNKKYVKFQIRPTDNSQAEVLENWQICHFRLVGDSNYFPYGRSYIEGARRIWKQLSLLEDAMMIHRVVRAPERRIFYVDIGNIPPAEVDNYMQKLQDKIKKVPYMDERTGEYNLKYNLQNMLDDFYIPIRGSDSGTRIDTLPGMDWTGIDDVEYLKNKMFAALKIPKTFLNFGEEGGSKATLSNEDIRFARTIQRIQKLICSELEKIGIIHLYAQGYRDESLIDFKLELTNSSTIFEKEKLEILSDKTALAADMMETKLFPPEWIYKNIFKMSNDDSNEVMKGVVEFAKRQYRLDSIQNDGDDPANPFKKIGTGHVGGEKEHSGGGLGGLGGGGGLGDLKDLEGGGDEAPETKEKGEAPETPDSAGAEEVKKPDDMVKEDKNRDQSGEHKASDHPFGEDPTGQLELNRKPRKNSEFKRKSNLSQNFEGDSPYSLKETKKSLYGSKVKSQFITSLKDFFDDKNTKNIKQELIREAADIKPIITHNNISV